MLTFLSKLGCDLSFCFASRLYLGLQVAPNVRHIDKTCNTQQDQKSEFTIGSAMGMPMKSKYTAAATIREFRHWFMRNIKSFFCYSGVFFLETVPQQTCEPQFLLTF